MGDRAEAFQSDLRGGTFHGVNRTEKTVDLFGIVVAFERNQAVADDLEMFLGFGLEKFENFGADFVIERQRIEIRPGNTRLRSFRLNGVSGHVARLIIQRYRLNWECEAIAFLESSDVLDVFFSGIADFQEIGFKQGNSIRQKLGQGAVQVFAERRVQRILKNVRQLSGDFGEVREAVAG